LFKNKLKNYFSNAKLLKESTILGNVILGYIVGEIRIGKGFYFVGEKRLC